MQVFERLENDFGEGLLLVLGIGGLFQLADGRVGKPDDVIPIVEEVVVVVAADVGCCGGRLLQLEMLIHSIGS